MLYCFISSCMNILLLDCIMLCYRRCIALHDYAYILVLRVLFDAFGHEGFRKAIPLAVYPGENPSSRHAIAGIPWIAGTKYVSPQTNKDPDIIWCSPRCSLSFSGVLQSRQWTWALHLLQCASECQLRLNVVVYNAAMACCPWHHSIQLLESMWQEGVVPDVVSTLVSIKKWKGCQMG